jgi:CheY-like chemotaxis protein
MYILLVEDNELQGELLKEMLSAEKPLKVVLVTSAESALLLVNDTKVDLIVSDVNLPKMSGYELAKTLKQGKYKAIPFFLYSSRAPDDEDIELALAEGVDRYIEKTGVQGIYEDILNHLPK